MTDLAIPDVEAAQGAGRRYLTVARISQLAGSRLPWYAPHNRHPWFDAAVIGFDYDTARKLIDPPSECAWCLTAHIGPCPPLDSNQLATMTSPSNETEAVS